MDEKMPFWMSSRVLWYEVSSNAIVSENNPSSTSQTPSTYMAL